MPGLKTNEQPGTRAVLRHFRMSATKARQVLDLVRGQEVDRAADILGSTPREAADVIGKVLASAVANARNNDGLDPDELYISACYADEGTTLKRWRPRARGRATRIRKRTCHITVIVSRLPDDRLERRRAKQTASAGAMRSRRVAGSRRTAGGDTAESKSESKSSSSDQVVDDELSEDLPEIDEQAEHTDESVETESGISTDDDGDTGDTAKGDVKDETEPPSAEAAADGDGAAEEND